MLGKGCFNMQPLSRLSFGGIIAQSLYITLSIWAVFQSKRNLCTLKINFPADSIPTSALVDTEKSYYL